MLDKDVSSIQNDVNCYIPLPVSNKEYSKEHSQGENGVVIPPFFFSSLCIINFVSFCVSSPKHSNHAHHRLITPTIIDKKGEHALLLGRSPVSRSKDGMASVSGSFIGIYSFIVIILLLFHHRRDPPAHSLLLPHQHPYHRQGHQCRRALGSIIIHLLMVIILTIIKIIGDNKFLFLSDTSQSAQQLLSQ